MLTTSSPARPSVRWTTPHITVGATLPRDKRWNRCDAPCAICERRDFTPPSTLGESTTNNRARNRTPASAADRINLALSTLPAEPPPRPASAALPGTRQKRPEDERGSATGLWDRSSRDREPASRSWRRRALYVLIRLRYAIVFALRRFREMILCPKEGQAIRSGTPSAITPLRN